MAVIGNDIELRQEIASLRRKQENWSSLFEVSSTYAFIGLTLWALKHYPAGWMYALAFVALGFMQYRLVMSTHEATHKTLFYPVWLNEFFGVFHSALVGISFFNYRKTHLEHHKNPQSIDEDIDSYIYRPLLETKPGFPRLALLVFGVLLDISEKVKRKLIGARRRHEATVTTKNASSLPGQMIPILLSQGALFAFFAWYLHWSFYFVFWVAPVLLIALSLDRARTFLEHGYQYIFSNQTFESFKQAPQSTIDVDTNPIERYLFAPFGFSYHQAHHTYLTVPYYNLHKLADLLQSNEPSYFKRVHGSYLAILVRMIWADK